MAEEMNFLEKSFEFTNNSVRIIKSCFGPNGVDCMLSTSSGALVVTNNGYQVLKTLSYESPVAHLIFKGMEKFYLRTGDFSKKFFLVLRELLSKVLDTVSGREVSQQQQQELAISQGMSGLLIKILPKLLNDSRDLNIVWEKVDGLEKVKRIILSIFNTNINGKCSPKTSKELIHILEEVLFDDKETHDIKCLKLRTRMLLDTFADIFWEVPGLPLSSSVVLPGIVIPQSFVTMLHHLPKNPSNQTFKFLLLGTSLGYDLPQSDTVLALKHEKQVKAMLEWRAKFIKNILLQLINHNIELIISSVALPETVIHFCNQFQLAAIQLVPQEDVKRICNVFEINPLFELQLDKELTQCLGIACGGKPVRVGQHVYLYLEPVKSSYKQVFLHGPSEAMCRHYSTALQNALKSLNSAFKEQGSGINTLSLVTGGGAFELGLAFAIGSYRMENRLETYVDQACCILEKALLSIPRQLIENSGKKLPVCSVTAQVKEGLSSGMQLHGLSKTGTLCDVHEDGIIEPMMANFWLVFSVLQLFIQVLRTDKIICVKALHQRNDSDDESDDECNSLNN